MTFASFDEALSAAGVTERMLSPEERQALDQDGFALLRGVYDAERRAALIDLFERKYLPSDQWPAPRGFGTRHAVLADEPEIWRACLEPCILAAVHHILKRRFFLADLDGRDPLVGQGHQALHRDWVVPQGPAPMVVALGFLDDFGPANGATRVVRASHRQPGAEAYADVIAHPDEVVVAGEGGDVLVFDGYLAHGGTRNTSGAPRRNIQIGYHAIEERANYVEKRNLTGLTPLERYLLGAND